MSLCTPVIGCQATASSLKKGSTKVLADFMYLMENGGYCINRLQECEGDGRVCDRPESRNQALSQRFPRSCAASCDELSAQKGGSGLSLRVTV